MAYPVSQSKVSHRGQMNLPADLRRSWGITDGGSVTFVDLGGSALVLPGTIADANTELHQVLVVDGGYELSLRQLADPDLADQ